ncbi:hypothetical protein BJY04DRAFT_213797 [Aspergillus karnatakaensis]|uniref:uncharacterized protein n=1 Tax=Aspergillus karnatakaensis TaxID=1810916 RepID=UPI003CCD1E82
MDTHDQLAVSERLRSTAIPIAHLSPDLDRLQESTIHSVVTLLWPYSSSTKSLSVLLAEPDFRLRRSNGQVKVTFHGSVAEEVAGTHLGIGDKVYLSLAGSRLVKNDAAAQTPGKGVSWDVHFDTSAFIEIWRDSKPFARVSIEHSSPTPPPADHVPATPSTPAANGHAYTSGPLGAASWQSPAFLGKSRVSFGLTNAPLDPFVEEDGFVPGKGRKRPRFSMGGTEWRVIDEPESPRERDPPEDWMNMFDEELETGSDTAEEPVAQEAEPSAVSPVPKRALETSPELDRDVAMADAQTENLESAVEQPANGVSEGAEFVRPTVASRSVPESAAVSGLGHFLNLPTNTPRLQPISSPSLPDPSPICTTSNSPSGYFMAAIDAAAAAQSITPSLSISEDVHEDVSELDHATPPQVRSDGEHTHHDEDDAVTVYTDDVSILPDSVLQSEDVPSSPQVEGSNVARSTIIADNEEVRDEELSDNNEEDVMEQGGEDIRDDSSEIEAEPQLGHEGDEEEIVSSPRADEGGRPSNKRLPEHIEREDDESDGASAVWSENEDVDGEVPERQKDDKPHLIESDPVSPESRDVSEQPDRHYDDEDQDELDEDDEGQYDEGEYYEDDYEDGDEESQHKVGYGYDYSESERESDYEEPRPPAKPKNIEPEIIVLDSDSEDEPPAKQQISTSGREVDEYSDGGSYYSEDQDRADVGEGGFDDEEEGEEGRYEDEEEDRDEYARREEYEMDDEMDEDVEEEVDERDAVGGIDEEIEDDLEDDIRNQRKHSLTGGRPAGDEHPEVEYVEADDYMEHGGVDEDHPQDVQEQPDTSFGVTFAEPPLVDNHDPALNGLPTAQEYLEDYQATTEYPHVPAERDPLDYLAAVSESAERIITSEQTQQGYDMAIDPSLYALGAPQNVDPAIPSALNDPEEDPGEVADVTMESPESKRERFMALQLDGAAPLAMDDDSTGEVSQLSVRREALQLITPGPSQVLKVEGSSSPVAPPSEMLPTPILTQETVTLHQIIEPALSPSDIQPPSTVLENTSASPSVPTKVDEEPVIKQEETEPAPPVVVVEPAPPTLLDEDQILQASIEVDDAEEPDNNINTSPIDRNYPGLRSKLSYFAPLATLIDHYNALVDTISIACEVRPATKATSGKKDFILTLQLTDQSMAGTTIYAQILRPYKPALPTLQEGDAILLRNFRVKSLDHSVILVSDSTSAWAVFSASSPDNPQTNGPPVEFGDEEKTFAMDLRQWYLEDGLAMVADNQLQASVGRESRAVTPGSSVAPSDAGSIDLAVREARGDTSSSGRGGSRRRKSHRRITIHELRDGRRYTEVGSSPGEDSIHELRDGTVYANL